LTARWSITAIDKKTATADSSDVKDSRKGFYLSLRDLWNLRWLLAVALSEAQARRITTLPAE
jgi:hypothetical protein